jgi:acetyl esterase
MTIELSNSVKDYNYACGKVLPEDYYNHDVILVRQYYRDLFACFPAPQIEGIIVRNGHVTDGASGRLIPIRIFRKEGSLSSPRPCIIYAHGGGFISGELEALDGLARDLVVALDVTVVTFNYRLAPEHRHPAAIEDCLTTYLGVRQLAAADGIDPESIYFAGESCGGSFAIGLALMLRDQGLPQLRGSIAINPVLDIHRWAQKRVKNCTVAFQDEMHRFTRDYLGTGDDLMSDYASPLLAGDISGLPSTVLWATEADPLAQEVKLFAERLQATTTKCVLHIEKGAVHGCLRARHHYHFAEVAFENLCGCIRDIMT